MIVESHLGQERYQLQGRVLRALWTPSKLITLAPDELHCPTVDSTATESENNHLASNANNIFKVYHQNIRGLKGKVQEFTTELFPELPYILCLTEHHLKEDKIDISNANYNLGAKFCRQVLKNGGICIFIHESIKFMNINLHNSCKEQGIEIYAVKLNLSTINIVIISIYRSPSGNFS